MRQVRDRQWCITVFRILLRRATHPPSKIHQMSWFNHVCPLNINYLAPCPCIGEKYYDPRVCMFVCFFVRSLIWETTRPNFTKFYLRVTRDCSSVLLWRQMPYIIYYTLYDFGSIWAVCPALLVPARLVSHAAARAVYSGPQLAACRLCLLEGTGQSQRRHMFHRVHQVAALGAKYAIRSPFSSAVGHLGGCWARFPPVTLNNSIWLSSWHYLGQIRMSVSYYDIDIQIWLRYCQDEQSCQMPRYRSSFFPSFLWGDVAICAEASSGPHAQPHIP